MTDRTLTRRQLLQAGSAAAVGLILTRPAFGWPQAGKSTLLIRFEELPDLYSYLRWGSSNAGKLGQAWKPALAEMNKAAEVLTGRLAFASIDSLIADSLSLAPIEEALPNLPEKGPGGLPFRQPLTNVVQAIKLAEPLYKKEIATKNAKIVADAQAGIKSMFMPKQRELVDGILGGLRIPDKDKEVPIFLVADAPAPGGFTVRSRKSGAVCYVSVNSHPGTLLYETILHEATHAFDVAGGVDSGSVLDKLQKGLAKNKIASDDPLMRNVPHTLFFVHAGATVRRVLDPKHRDYGEATGLYKRTAATSDPVIKHWHTHLEGKCTADEAVDRIIADVLKS